MPLIPFYGSRHPELFAIERAAMDRSGQIARALDRLLPRTGLVLDIGAGDGFLAHRLSSSERRVLALEPDPGMMRLRRSRIGSLSGEAEALPFGAQSFDGAYATWAYFFPSRHPIEDAIHEAERVLKPGSMLALANNLGGDELCALSPSDISEPSAPFLDLGFALQVVDTFFEFDSLEHARGLLGFYFGAAGRRGARIKLSFRVGLYYKRRGGAEAACSDDDKR